MSGAQINPLLIHLMTKQPLNEISSSPTISALPGKYGRLINRQKNTIEKVLTENFYMITCKSCGRKGKYNVGMLFFEPERVKDGKTDDVVQTTGYFRCKHCNDAGNWEMPVQFKLFTMVRLMEQAHPNFENNGDDGFAIGESLLYDKSWHLYCSDAEIHLLNKLKAESKNSFIWNRLGNMYHRGDRPELAAAVYEYSLFIDPNQMESHYSLGRFFTQIQEYEKAAYHYKQLLLGASDYSIIPAVNLRSIITEALMDLLFISLETNEEISFLPTREELKKADKLDSVGKKQVELELDLTFEDHTSFYPLAEMYMGKQQKKIPFKERRLNIKNPIHKKKKRWKEKKGKKRK